MKKSIKLVFFSIAIFFFASFLLLLGGSFLLYKGVTTDLDIELTYFETMEIWLNRNAEKESVKEVKETYLQEDYHHVSIYYKEDFQDLLPITRETLDLAFAKTEALFGKISYEPVDFILVEDGVELAKISGKEDLGGFYTEIDRVFAIQYYDKELILERDEFPLYIFQEIILHEYTHYAFARKTHELEKYPEWFTEGVAEYVTDEGWGASIHAFELIPFAQLITQEQWEEAKTMAGTDNYAQSYYAVKYLIDEYGVGVISEIMDSVNKTKDFEQSFKKITGLTISELEKVNLETQKY
ncbi:hypothetical protein DHX103_00480 [Planococcus sp. X10-3]|uniref:hypothetical protein n=1 Tax=Planococcus sp. X10-3 TaxID=3061240 RepID=UPI003BB1F94C